MTLFELIREHIDENLSEITEDLVNGNAKDYAQYQHMCGVIKGLHKVRMYTTEIDNNIELEDS